ncbi:MAG: helix-turn-helix transcriptional regulator [Bdellovibrionales bacterium]|nr:helix-turn-helix transcriptional regulator [Bdellovibrionales bacterium]
MSKTTPLKQASTAQREKLPAARKKSVELNVGLGKLVEQYRTEMKLSLEDLSELTQVPVRDLSRLENGECTLALEKLFRISNYLNIPPSELLAAIHR